MDPDGLSAALKRLAGTDRVVVYDLSEAEAPERSEATTPFVRGSQAWWRFIDRRRALDDGNDLNLLVSLRGLRADERLLAVNWGTAFANSFLVVEPSDPWLDLTTPEGISEFESRTLARGADALVRAAYAEWIYWVHDEQGDLDSRAATLSLSDPRATLWQTLWERLPQAFPASAFLSSLTLLTLREAELFTDGREVARAITPFLTRLGLPILYDARHVLHGVRQLVNAGLAGVQDPEDGYRVYRGPADPLPTDIPDERLALMIR
ncbi:MAG: hypothetical protein GEU75_16770 [Dehalococcoidia bacterium]|nr:hypothetical protein [Dehalococcoidia bacterium]